ncbi:LuxR C-terminal-related transcriptional regulator [Caballeronia sp. AZ10_KS36]|uniref:response regulator transcription factor n=1 Tax=Caballeronia sp. AZ10_KS36 TaxID=2921757 RepID=UPI002027A256
MATVPDKRKASCDSQRLGHDAVLVEFADATGLREVGTIELGGKVCRVIVDGAGVPRAAHQNETPVTPRGGDEPIVRFEFEGQHYAVVTERPMRPMRPDYDAMRAPDGAIGIDIMRMLSRREMEVVQLVCMGFLTKQIAGRLQISEFTVRTYVKTIYAKLGVRSRAALVYRFMRAMNNGVRGSGE